MFTEKDTWSGGHYELAIELGDRSDAKLLEATLVIWKSADLDGCYLDRKREPSEQQQVSPAGHALSGLHLQGIARLPNGSCVACGTCAVREINGPDWITLYFPVGALSLVYSLGGYPFEDTDSSKWEVPVSDWLAGIGKRVFEVVPFRLGLVGFEVSGTAYSKELEASGIPEQRWVGYLSPRENQLTWYPPNKWPQF